MKSIRDMKVLNLDQIRYGGSAVSGLLSVGKTIPCREENSKRTHVLKPLQEVCYKGKGQLKMRRAADIIKIKIRSSKV